MEWDRASGVHSRGGQVGCSFPCEPDQVWPARPCIVSTGPPVRSATDTEDSQCTRQPLQGLKLQHLPQGLKNAVPGRAGMWSTRSRTAAKEHPLPASRSPPGAERLLGTGARALKIPSCAPQPRPGGLQRIPRAATICAAYLCDSHAESGQRGRARAAARGWAGLGSARSRGRWLMSATAEHL